MIACFDTPSFNVTDWKFAMSIIALDSEYG